MKVSYQTRIKDLEAIKVLDQMGPAMSRPIRILFSKTSQKSIVDKPSFQKEYFLTSRLFNSCQVEALARYQNSKENKANQVASLEGRVAAVSKELGTPRIQKDLRKLHYKKRKLQSLQDRLTAAQEEIQNRSYSCIFGSKDLWKKQFNLKANNYGSHSAWREDWELARNYNFLVLGSKDEITGNQSCQLELNIDGSYDLELKLPTNFPAKHLQIKNLVFTYGREIIDQVYYQNQNKKDRQAITYRFHKDHKGWIVTLTTELAAKELVTNGHCGVLGVDLNPDHLAVTETDRYGNPVGIYTFPLELKDKSHHQSLAIIGVASKQLVELAKTLKKPLVVEILDFEAKKAALAASHSPQYAQMLSSFAYSATLRMLKSRAYRYGVEVVDVDPAYTSLIGLLKFKKHYGLTTHHAAALVIGRRCHHRSERLPRSKESYKLWMGGVLVTLEKPESQADRSRHVRTSWGKLKRQMEAFWKKHRTKDPESTRSQKNLGGGVMTTESSMGTKKLNPKNAVPS